MKKTLVLEIISFLFVLLFVYAATSKLFDYDTFVIQVGQSPLLTGFGHIIPWMVIASELIVAAMLAFHKLRLFAFFAAFGIMTAFTTYIIVILNYSSFIPCSCGGVLSKLGWTEHLIFNIAFTILAVIAIVLQYTAHQSNKEHQTMSSESHRV